MSRQLSSYLSPKLETRETAYGNGTFALQPLMKNELIAVFGGNIYHWDQFIALSEKDRSLSLQIEENLFIVPEYIGDGDYVNHCCDPNAGLAGQIVLVAMRDIQPGEEICFDYAMSDGSPYDEFDCGCGTPHCRGSVSGNDWRNPELQERYAGYFTPYIQRLIDAERQAAKSLNH